ncbi:MAG: hypothetical protein BMS9Abin21_267 [Thermodesulfovibrionia bacterium]|nr:MAG: hypothetical protein BMS9Abin21_267 [Thermodesulfovibrionia bacterium]
MKTRYVMASLIFAGFLFLNGCGSNSTGGAPGTSGSEDTGIMIRAVSIIDNDATPGDIDVNNHVCSDGKTEPINALHLERATITIDAALINPGFDTFPASVEECTITYKKANEDPASPIIEQLTDYPNCPVYEEETNECVVDLIDVQRKVDYWDDFSNGLNTPAEYPTRYIAVYNCKYVNIYGESGTFQVEYGIRLADFETCSN